MLISSPHCYLFFIWLTDSKSYSHSFSSGLLERLTELREMFTYIDQLIFKGIIKDSDGKPDKEVHTVKYVEGGAELPCPLGTNLPESPHFHQGRSCQNSTIPGFCAGFLTQARLIKPLAIRGQAISLAPLSSRKVLGGSESSNPLIKWLGFPGKSLHPYFPRGSSSHSINITKDTFIALVTQKTASTLGAPAPRMGQRPTTGVLQIITVLNPLHCHAPYPWIGPVGPFPIRPLPASLYDTLFLSPCHRLPSAFLKTALFSSALTSTHGGKLLNTTPHPESTCSFFLYLPKRHFLRKAFPVFPFSRLIHPVTDSAELITLERIS